MKPASKKYRIVKTVDKYGHTSYEIQERFWGFLFWTVSWPGEHPWIFKTLNEAEGWLQERFAFWNRPTYEPYRELIGYYGETERDNYLTLTPELMDAVREGNRDKEIEILAKMEKLRHGTT